MPWPDTATSGLTIRDVSVRTVVTPFATPLATKVGHFAEWPLVLIDLQTEQGPVGRSYLAPYLLRAVRGLVPLIRDLGRDLRGRPVSPHRLRRDAAGLLGLAGYQGLATSAVAGLDIAVWDLLAQEAGVPLARLLGGSADPVPAYNSNGLGLEEPDGLGEQALALVAEGGFSMLKVRVGRARPEEDLAAVQAVRDAVGGDVTLVVDYNQGLTPDQALPRCRSLDDLGLGWIEEPLRYDDLRGHARLARDLHTPIMLGENFYGPRTMLDAVQAEACDLVMPDLMRIGGVTGWLESAALAHTTGTPMSSHLYPEVSAHLMNVTPTAHWLEWQDWAHPILAEPFVVRDGMVHLPEVPGNGIAWDESAVSRYGIDA